MSLVLLWNEVVVAFIFLVLLRLYFLVEVPYAARETGHALVWS